MKPLNRTLAIILLTLIFLSSYLFCFVAAYILIDDGWVVSYSVITAAVLALCYTKCFALIMEDE